MRGRNTTHLHERCDLICPDLPISPPRGSCSAHGRERNPDTLVRYIGAYVEGLRWVMQPRTKPRALHCSRTTPSKVGASRRSGRNVEPLHKAVPQTRMRGSGNVHEQSQSTQFLLTVEQRATESTHDPQTLRSPCSQAAPDLLGANPCCCLERRRHHSERDSARFHPLRGHQDRYARRGHHHVSAAHWRSKQSTVKQRRWPHERSWTQQHWINAA